MYSMLLLLAAGLAVPVLAYGIHGWRRSRSGLLLFPVIVLAGAVLEAGLAGAGRWLGPGDTLRDLQAFPVLIRLFVLPMTLFTFATLCRRAGFAWARIDWGHGAVCILAVLLLLAGLPGMTNLKLLVPACWQDVVWYLDRVPAALTCPGGMGTAGTLAFPALAARLTLVVVMLAWLGLGAGLWFRHRWPWLLAGLLPGAALGLMPWTVGPLPALIGALVAFGTMVQATVILLQRFSDKEAPSQ